MTVLVSLLASFLSVPVEVPHLLIGLLWTVAAAWHLLRRWPLYRTLLLRRVDARMFATTLLAAAALACVVSGFVQWAGVAAATPWHGGSSILLMVVGLVHAATRLWRRVRGRRAAAVAAGRG